MGSANRGKWAGLRLGGWASGCADQFVQYVIRPCAQINQYELPWYGSSTACARVEAGNHSPGNGPALGSSGMEPATTFDLWTGISANEID